MPHAHQLILLKPARLNQGCIVNQIHIMKYLKVYNNGRE